jgi:NAD(P)-dependent dehydrogenase (short-subunit alcohol dehydrogenase family)
MRLQDKVAVVTGAGSGIGRATALRFAAEGGHVACVDASAEGVAATVQAIARQGGAAIGLTVDVTSEASCAEMVERTLEAFGRLTTLVNSAGVRAQLTGERAPMEEWRRVVDVNLTGTYVASRAALPRLQEAGGAIVNLASIYGLVGGATSSAYAASKGGVANLTRQLALEWAPRVRVNCVCPGVIETPMTAELRDKPGWAEKVLRAYPLGRFGQPEEIAAAILYLASDEAAFVTGVALPVDGGYTAR